MSKHEIKHGLYLTIGREGEKNDGSLIAICSDGTPQRNHFPVTVLSVTRVRNKKEAREWYRKVIRDRPWEKNDESIPSSTIH